MSESFCDPKCWEMPECKVCGRRKHPMGRDPGVAAGSGYCGPGCTGYYEQPRAGHWWPDEEPELRAKAEQAARERLQ